MGSKKHKKHHKSEKKELSLDDRPEKPLKLVLKVGGSIQSPVHHASNSNSVPSPRLVPEEPRSSSHSHEKHKKSKKKKKKKSADKDRHERKRKHHHHHHHHREHSHERKEKRRKEQDTSRLVPSESQDSRDSVPVKVPVDYHPMIPAEKPIRDVRTCTLKKKTKSHLQILLYSLLKKLQLKDPQDFFAWPVTDVIAPGYSSIIPNPIDFSTIIKKIDDKEYLAVAEFKIDIKLMCDNAMTYNRADTVYYKSAKRMWHYAQKLMNREQLISMKRSFPYMVELTVEELGFNINDEGEESLPGTEIVAEPGICAPPEAKKSKVAPCWTEPEEEDDDDMNPEDILLQAQQAAKAAADRLTLRKPNSKFGFLRQNENGTTTLSVIHSRSGDREMKVNLEMLTGKVAHGTGTIAGYKEDSKNIIKPIHYNNYGSYSSYAPHYDSTFSNLSKDESDLVLSTYGDELGMQFAERCATNSYTHSSLTTFGRGSDYVMRMVDNLLDSLTGGEHSKTMKIIEEKKMLREEEVQARKALKPLNENEIPLPIPSSPDLESLQALEDIELELSRLESVDENKKLENGDLTTHEHRRQLLHQRRAIQQKLDNATQLLHELKRVQGERLSAHPPPHLGLVRPPSALEHDLAERVTKKLVDVSSHLPPETITSVKGLRKAMGITYEPVVSAKYARKSTSQIDLERSSIADSSMMQTESPMDHNSPVETEDRNAHQDLETDLREFLVAGPILRVSRSPTES